MKDDASMFSFSVSFSFPLFICQALAADFGRCPLPGF